MTTRDTIRDFYNRIIGYIETDTWTKVQTARDFYNVILGTYDPKMNVTRDFYGRILAHGNILSSLIYQEEAKKQSKK